MHTPYELEHYYCHGTWPYMPQLQNHVQLYKCVGICCEPLTSFLKSTGTEIMVKRALVSASFASLLQRQKDLFFLVERAALDSLHSQLTNDMTTFTFTKQP